MKFFLSVGLLLLSGYSQVFSLASLDCLPGDHVGVARRSLDAIAAIGYHEAMIKPGSSGSGKENRGRNVAEFELREDEVISSRKFIENSNSYTVLFDAGISERFLCYVRRTLSPSKLSHISSCGLHLVFQVFRI